MLVGVLVVSLCLSMLRMLVGVLASMLLLLVLVFFLCLSMLRMLVGVLVAMLLVIGPMLVVRMFLVVRVLLVLQSMLLANQLMQLVMVLLVGTGAFAEVFCLVCQTVLTGVPACMLFHGFHSHELAFAITLVGCTSVQALLMRDEAILVGVCRLEHRLHVRLRGIRAAQLAHVVVGLRLRDLAVVVRVHHVTLRCMRLLLVLPGDLGHAVLQLLLALGRFQVRHACAPLLLCDKPIPILINDVLDNVNQKIWRFFSKVLGC